MNHYYSLKTASNANHQAIGVKAKQSKKKKRKEKAKGNYCHVNVTKKFQL